MLITSFWHWQEWTDMDVTFFFLVCWLDPVLVRFIPRWLYFLHAHSNTSSYEHTIPVSRKKAKRKRSEGKESFRPIGFRTCYIYGACASVCKSSTTQVRLAWHLGLGSALFIFIFIFLVLYQLSFRVLSPSFCFWMTGMFLCMYVRRRKRTRV